MATGSFPAFNKFVDRYGPKDVLFIGGHILRDPPIRENNILHAIDRLKPKFPVFDQAWVGEIPVPILPWAIVFDHEGNRTFAGNLKGLKEALDEAVARAPDRIVGGPYPSLKKMTARMAKEKAKFGPAMETLRKILSDKGEDPVRRQDAANLLERLESYAEKRFDRAEGLLPNVVAAAAIYEKLARLFEGDALGERAAQLRDALTSNGNFGKEEAALEAFGKARAAFIKRPPAVTYAYNLSFTKVTDRSVLAKRAKILAAYRKALETIIAKYPGTFAAGEAADVIEYDLDDEDDI